jgi:hypothetical protein
VRAHAESGQFFGYYVALEVGAVQFSFNKNFAFYNKFENQRYFAFSYNVPFERVFQRYRELKQSK